LTATAPGTPTGTAAFMDGSTPPGPGTLLTVTNTLDAGPGSLRQAILDADANPGADTIAFNIGGGGVQTISPASPLPAITGPVTIDGTTQPGYHRSPLIVLTGTSAGWNAIGLTISAGASTVKGLVINCFFIGIDLAGQGGNLLEGNFIGTDVTGTQRLQNLTGVEVSSSNNTVGGTTAGGRNLISGNGSYGIDIISGGGNLIQGNYIGTDVTGTIALANNNGVYLYGSNNTVGGTTAAGRNLISNETVGIAIINGSGNLIQGNYVGTDITGTKALGNQQDGVDIYHGSNNTIGGTAANAGNTIAFHTYDGVLVDGGTGNAIRRDAIFGWNSHLGIDLTNGGNHNQAAPVITSATSGGGTITISGTLTSTANTTFTLEFFRPPSSAKPVNRSWAPAR
jgi:hypothetical protein